MSVSVCGFLLFLRFRRAPSKLKDPEDHGLTVKVPTGNDPTYGVSDTSNLPMRQSKMTILALIYISCFFRKFLMSFVLQEVGQAFHIWFKELWRDKSLLLNVLVSFILVYFLFSFPLLQ